MKEKEPSRYLEFQDCNLIALELKYHSFCYREYTRSCKTKIICDQNQEEQDSSLSAFDKGDWERVVKCITENVIEKKQASTIDFLQQLYGIGIGDSRYRTKLKSRITKHFGDRILFLHAERNFPSVIVNGKLLTSDITFSKCEECLIRAAEFLREDITQYIASLPPTSWPPTLDELESEDRDFPTSVKTFLTYLLKTSDKHNPVNQENKARLISSYSADLVHGVSCGSVMTRKHFLFALGLLNITGQKKVIEITNKLGHCMTYDMSCKIKTAQAMKAQKMSEMNSILPLKPKDKNSTVLTFYWVDSFDINVEKQRGGGAVNTTHLCAFQEPDENAIKNVSSISVKKTKSLWKLLTRQKLYQKLMQRTNHQSFRK